MNKRIIGALIILAAALTRLLPHVPNVVPVTAIALAGGVYLERKYALLLPIAAMLISDCLIGFHATVPFVYGSILLVGFIGMHLASHKSFGRIALGTVAGSVIFFVVTNFGVWLTGGGWFYPKTFAGLAECFAMALPFFRNSLIGDCAYTAVLFGLFEFVEYFARVSGKPQVGKQ